MSLKDQFVFSEQNNNENILRATMQLIRKKNVYFQIMFYLDYSKIISHVMCLFIYYKAYETGRLPQRVTNSKAQLKLKTKLKKLKVIQNLICEQCILYKCLYIETFLFYFAKKVISYKMCKRIFLFLCLKIKCIDFHFQDHLN